MQFEAQRLPADPFAFEDGGTISGPTIHTASVELDRDVPLADLQDGGNYMKFVENNVEFGKGIRVLGTLEAPNWSNNAQYPVNATFQSVTVNGDATATNLMATHEVTTPTLNASTGIITPLISGTDADFTGLVTAENLEVTDTLTSNKTFSDVTRVTTKLLTNVIKAPVDQSTQEQEIISTNVDASGPQITVGGGSFVINDVNTPLPKSSYRHNEIHHGYNDTDGLKIEQDKATVKFDEANFIATPDDMTFEIGHLTDDSKSYKKTMTVGNQTVEIKDAATGRKIVQDPFKQSTVYAFQNSAELKTINWVMTNGSRLADHLYHFYGEKAAKVVDGVTDLFPGDDQAHEMRRMLAADHTFQDGTDTHHFQLHPESANSLHLSATQMDLTDPDSLVNKTGADLLNALKSVRNPRTIIKGEQATFGLHQNEESASDVHLLLSQSSTSEPSFMHVKVDRQYLQCTNQDDDNGAFQVYFKGYDNGAPSVDQGHSGTRLGVNNQGAHGKVYLGRWDRGMPSNSINDIESNFADVNVAGEVRFSTVPGSFTSGDIMARLKTTGLELSDIRPLTQRVDFHGAVDFSNAAVTGLPGGAGGYPSLSENIDNLQLTKPLYGPTFGFDDSLKMHFSRDGAFEQVQTKMNNGTLLADLLVNTATGSSSYTVNADETSMGALQLSKDDITVLDVNRPLATGDTPQTERTVALFRNNSDAVFAINSTYARSLNPIEVVTQGTLPDQASILVDRYPGTQQQNEGLLRLRYNDDTKVDIFDQTAFFYVKTIMTKNGSSGHFTHCHVMEPDFQGQDWENRVGLAVESTGYYCVRDDSGAKVDDPAQPPGPEYAMTSATLAQEDCLGIISSVELVQNQNINHEHGGLTIATPIAEADGYKVLRVAAAGDVFAWVCKPLLADCPLPYLGGQYSKTVDGVEAGTVFAVTDGKTIKMDGREGTIDGRTHTLGGDGQIGLTANELTISLTATQTEGLTPDVLSGSYQKYVNGVLQPTGVVINCNADYSFTWTEKTPSVEARIAALEAAWNEMTGPD